MIKRCVLTWASIWNQPELYTSSRSGVIKALLEVKNDLWISYKSGLVRPRELKFLPEAYLTKITHPWKFQLKRTFLSGKSFLRGGTPLNKDAFQVFSDKGQYVNLLRKLYLPSSLLCEILRVSSSKRKCYQYIYIFL